MRGITAMPVAAFLVCVPALAQEAADAQHFVNMATSSNMFEIQSSELALKKAQTEPAKAFAQHMIADHTKAGEEMKAAAGAAKVTVPAELEEKHQAKIERLTGLDGMTFDKEYISEQVAAHEEAVALFEEYSSEGQDGPLKDFAAKTLPTLQGHLDEVQKLAGE